jgi:hypothetical protein
MNSTERFSKQKQEITEIDRKLKEAKMAASYARNLDEKLPAVREKRKLETERRETRRKHILENFTDETVS